MGYMFRVGLGCWSVGWDTGAGLKGFGSSWACGLDWGCTWGLGTEDGWSGLGFGLEAGFTVGLGGWVCGLDSCFKGGLT